MPSLIFVGDIGASIEVTTENTTAPLTTTFTMNVLKPSGVSVVWAGTFTYATGIMSYSTLAGDVDEAGDYQVQIASVDSVSGAQLSSNIDTFTVYNLI